MRCPGVRRKLSLLVGSSRNSKGCLMPIPETETLDWLWLVLEPSPLSELGDVLFRPGSALNLRHWCVGGAETGHMPAATLYADEDAARADALARLAKRDREAQGRTD